MAFPWQQWFMTPQSIGLPTFGFSADLVTFTPIMAKRNGPGPFAAAPIVQGDWDGGGVPDTLRFPRGGVIGNQAQFEYANFDPYQGTIVLWWTPEKDRDATQTNDEYIWYANANYYCRYEHDNALLRLGIGGGTAFQAFNITAGTTYTICLRWDVSNTLDGTNYLCVSVNDGHSFGTPTQPIVSTPDATFYVGSNAGATLSANGIIEGFTAYRRPLTDGTYGVRPMNGNQYSSDEINAIHFAGAGRDPQLVTGSEDTCLCIPTNSTVGALATGAGEAWSWPWDDNLLDAWGGWDGGLPGTDRAVEFNGTTTVINCGSDVDIDDIMDAEATLEAWVRVNSDGTILYKENLGGTTGWSMYIASNNRIGARVRCAGTNATSVTDFGFYIPDDKWHHFVLYFDDAGDRKIYLAWDGVWVATYESQVAGIGAIGSDVGEDLLIGNYVAFTGAPTAAIAWAAISNNDRHTVGTDFIPPRAFPADDANYLASWPMDEGTGATIDNIGNQGGAGSGAANRDGTLANGTWSSIWEQDATPVIPQSVKFDGTTTRILCGSDVDIDDIHAGEFVAEAWIRVDAYGAMSSFIASKTRWNFLYTSGEGLIAEIECVTTNALSVVAASSFPADGKWHHVAMYFDGTALPAGSPVISFAIDGVWVAAYTTQDAGVGAVISDAAENLVLGNRFAGDRAINGALGWTAISNNARYPVGTNFVPPCRVNPPADDANYLALWPFKDGAGTTLENIGNQGGAGSGAANRDGTIADGIWNNTPDMEVDEPGAAIYGPKGYNIGVDAALEGMYIEQIVVAETDYVVFPVLSIGESGRARPRIRVEDVTGAADVVIFNGPMFYGTHQGGDDSATLIPTAPRWIADALIGATVYNITDGSSAVITDNTEGVVTAVLGGGTDDNWDDNDVFVIRFPRGYCERPWQESFCFQTPAACVLLRVYIENINAEGVMQFHQVQVLPNLMANGDHESLTGANPDIITGWANAGLDPGDTESSAGGGAIIHAGAEAMQWNAGAIAGESMYYNTVFVVGQFYAMGAWSYAVASQLSMGAPISARGLMQYSPTVTEIALTTLTQWVLSTGVLRATNVAVNPWLVSEGAGVRYSDDAHIIALDDVSITVTPASQVNSVEASGLRVDGRDACTQPITEITVTEGSIKFNWTPRHDAADALDFLEATDVYIGEWFGGANDYIGLYWSAANTITLAYNLNAGGVVTGNWNAVGAIVADTTYAVQIDYEGDGDMILTIGGVIRITLAGIPAAFGTVPGIAHWGKRDTGADDRQADATYA